VVEDLDEPAHGRALAGRWAAFGRGKATTLPAGGDHAADGACGDRWAFDWPDPDDVAAARRSYGPEQRLLAGVLARALADLSIEGGPHAKAASTAAAWIWGSPLPGSGWSFEAVCDGPNLDPDVVRQLAARTPSPRTRREHVPGTNTPRPTPPRAVHPEDLDQVDDVEAAQAWRSKRGPRRHRCR